MFSGVEYQPRNQSLMEGLAPSILTSGSVFVGEVMENV